MATDTPTNGTPTAGFTQAAEAAALLLDQLERYESALGQIDRLRADIGALREQIAAAVEPTKQLAAATGGAADAYRAIESARPDVEQTLRALQSATNEATAAIEEQIEATSTTVGQRVHAATDTATGRIEASVSEAAARVQSAADEGAERIDRSMNALNERLIQVDEATALLEHKVQTDGLDGAGRLVEALSAATKQIRQDSETTLAALTGPVQQTEESLARARRETETMVGDLRKNIDSASVDLRQNVVEADSLLKYQLAKADADFRESRGHDMSVLVRNVRLLVRLGTVTLGAILLVGLAGLIRGCTSTPGAPLEDAVVQVLNGVDPTRSIAGTVETHLLDEVADGQIAGVISADAATARQGETVILVHGASMEAGRELAALLGLDPSRVAAGTPLPFAGDVSILVGADYPESLPSVFDATP